MGRTFVHLALLAVACVAAAPLAHAETVVLKSELKAANEVPPNASAASGAAEASFDTATKTLSWKVTFSGLSGPPIGAHFHGPSEPGKNAGIVLPFKSPEPPITGSAVITDAQAADLLAGKWYANVHTQANPGGEIRGQMTRQ
ncbi:MULTISPECIES: CHRD domain-containing protein [unclassified Bradyrhizobium]|uniref:CHRD domain-containing protein n=1 Tax=unclassified Bradyrhizobium TaxID=2631580 RepID=UPI0028F0CF70|nr:MULTISPECIES: CHRD domain-containing protein [unclassified Bradyrhizobium]